MTCLPLGPLAVGQLPIFELLFDSLAWSRHVVLEDICRDVCGGRASPQERRSPVCSVFMDPAIISAVAGVGGAAVGAIASLVGARALADQQAALAREQRAHDEGMRVRERRDQRAVQAAQRCYALLMELPADLRKIDPTGFGPESQARHEHAQSLLNELRAEALFLPANFRDEIVEVSWALGMSDTIERHHYDSSGIVLRWASEYGLTCVASFVAGEPAPPSRPLVLNEYKVARAEFWEEEIGHDPAYETQRMRWRKSHPEIATGDESARGT
jgi:hypothetical protein